MIDTKNQVDVEFSSKLHPFLGKSTENSFYSPFSLLTALGMCVEGAKGETQNALVELLELPKTAKERKKYFKNFNKEAKGNDHYELKTANALWGANHLKYLDSFKKVIENDYAGVFSEVDYENDPDAAVLAINKWCDENTSGKIKKIISKSDIDKSTLLILTNAIYFLGKWKKEFDKGKTKDEAFFGIEKPIPMMHIKEKFHYMENDQFQALDIPYQGGDLSMLVVLPKEKTTEFVDNNLNNVYSEATENLRIEEVRVSLPKFKMETEYKVGNIFKEFGAGIAFSDDADFSGICSNEQLKISEIIHKAFVKCDEEGTEAAAVTAVITVRCTSVRMSRDIEFKANHPFVFFIRNNKTGTILFCGRVVNP